MANIDLISVDKFYGDHCILQNVNLRIAQGEFVAIVGPSGCGKSTLLRLVAGLDAISRGTILINDRCVNNIPAASRDMAMVFQNYALYPHMTVFENMAYGLKIRGMKKKDIQQRIHEVAKWLHIENFLQRKPLMLSGGQRQRVAMGRAIVRSPAVFLFDEPLSNLDAKLRTEMRLEIKKLHQKLQTTCLYVTHDQTEAMTMADKVVVLKQGRIEQIGTPRELYDHPASKFVASFIGHYPTNFLPAKIDLSQQKIVTMEGGELPLPRFTTDITCGDSVLVGIRPEYLKVVNYKTNTTLCVKVEFIDDMGADKLLHVRSELAHQQLSVRTSGDVELTSHSIHIEMELSKANLFCQQTGKRIGGWDEKEKRKGTADNRYKVI